MRWFLMRFLLSATLVQRCEMYYQSGACNILGYYNIQTEVNITSLIPWVSIPLAAKSIAIEKRDGCAQTNSK